MVDEAQVSFRAGGLTLTSRLIEGRVPELPPAPARRAREPATVSRQQLLDAVRGSGLMARDTTPVRLEFNALGVKLSSSSPDLGQAVETVEARYEGEDLTVAFNPRVPDRRAHGGGRGDGAARCPRRPEAGRLHGDGDEFTYLVMPVRLPAAVP